MGRLRITGMILGMAFASTQLFAPPPATHAAAPITSKQGCAQAGGTFSQSQGTSTCEVITTAPGGIDPSYPLSTIVTYYIESHGQTRIVTT